MSFVLVVVTFKRSIAGLAPPGRLRCGHGGYWRASALEAVARPACAMGPSLFWAGPWMGGARRRLLKPQQLRMPRGTASSELNKWRKIRAPISFLGPSWQAWLDEIERRLRSVALGLSSRPNCSREKKKKKRRTVTERIIAYRADCARGTNYFLFSSFFLRSCGGIKMPRLHGRNFGQAAFGRSRGGSVCMRALSV